MIRRVLQNLEFRDSGANQIKTIAKINVLQSVTYEITASNKKFFLERIQQKPEKKTNEKPKSVKW